MKKKREKEKKKRSRKGKTVQTSVPFRLTKQVAVHTEAAAAEALLAGCCAVLGATTKSNIKLVSNDVPKHPETCAINRTD